MKNLLLKEKNVLLQLLQKNREVLESKDVNSETKKTAWENIHAEFHSHKGVMKREMKQLRKFWGNTKLRYKKLYSGVSEATSDIFCMLQDPDYSIPIVSNDNDSGTCDTDTEAIYIDAAIEDRSKPPVDAAVEDEYSVPLGQDDITPIEEVAENCKTDTDADDVIFISIKNIDETGLDTDIATTDEPDKLSEDIQSSAQDNSNNNSTLKMKIKLLKTSDEVEPACVIHQSVNPESDFDLLKLQLNSKTSRKRKGIPSKAVLSKKPNHEETLNSLAELCSKVPTGHQLNVFDVMTNVVDSDVIHNNDETGITIRSNEYSTIRNALNLNHSPAIIPTDPFGQISYETPSNYRMASAAVSAVSSEEPLQYSVSADSVTNKASHFNTHPSRDHDRYRDIRRSNIETRGFHRHVGTAQAQKVSMPTLLNNHLQHSILRPTQHQKTHTGYRQSILKDSTHPSQQANHHKGVKFADQQMTDRDFLRLQMEQEKSYHAAKLALVKTDLDIFESEHQAKMHLIATQIEVVELQRLYWTRLNNQLNRM